MKKKNGSIFGGVIVGIILIIAGTVILWKNEENNVKNIKTVSEITDTAIEVVSNKIDNKNNGKLVITSGDINVIDDIVNDQALLIGVKTPILRRTVEVYQWREKENTDDEGNTTYSYTKEWSEGLIDSSSFNDSSHTNPTSSPYNSEEFTAKNVKIGEFNLSDNLVKELPTNANLDLTNIQNIPSGFTKINNYLTNAQDINNPNIGDIRISYQYNNYKTVTILAVQQNNSFVPFVSKVGKTVERIDEGTLNKDNLVQRMTNENNFLKWMLRLMGAIFIVIGYIALISPLTNVLGFIPLLGNLVNSALNGVLALIGLIHSLIVIAIAWFVFRPIVSICLGIIIVLLILLINKIIKKNKSVNNA